MNLESTRSNSCPLSIQLPQDLATREIELKEKKRNISDSFFNKGNLKSDVTYISPKRSYCDLNAIPPPTSIHSNSWVSDPSDPNKRIHSTLKISGLPHLQGVKKGYPAYIDILTKSFSDWSEEEQHEAVRKLKQLKIPLEEDRIYKIYALLKKHEDLLCSNDDVRYPALYAVTATYGESSYFSSNEVSFDLEIHATNKASLIFRNHETTFIGAGTSKLAWKTFALGKPEIRTHTFSQPHPNSAIYASQEECCFTQFKGTSWIAAVYDIYYYNVVINQALFEQQVMEMKYYPSDLHTIITTKSISKQLRLSYSIQIIEAIEDFNNKKLIYRDLKPENFLVHENGWLLALTDFGLSCDSLHLELEKTCGTPFYMAPENFLRKIDPDHPSLDIWSAGCLLWILLIGTTYPWYGDIAKEHPDFPAALQKMRDFESSIIDPNNGADPKAPLKFLIWNMLRWDPKNRWDPATVLNYLKSYQESLQRKIA